MTFLSKLRKGVARGVGATGMVLRKVGDLGGAIVRKVGDAAAIYRAANRGSGGTIGDLIESLPVVGGLAKTAGQKVFSNTGLARAEQVLRRVGGVGNTLQALGGALDKGGG